MYDLLAPLMAVVGVVIGWWLTNRTGETEWLRQLRIERYTKLKLVIDDGNKGLLELMSALARPTQFADKDAYESYVTEKAEYVNKPTAEIASIAQELAIFASPEVRKAALLTLTGWRDMLDALSDSSDVTPSNQLAGHSVESQATATSSGVAEIRETSDQLPASGNHGPSDSDVPTSQWPTPEVLQNAQAYAQAYESLASGLKTLTDNLVSTLRVDLGVDRGRLWHRLKWAVERQWTALQGRRSPQRNQQGTNVLDEDTHADTTR